MVCGGWFPEFGGDMTSTRKTLVVVLIAVAAWAIVNFAWTSIRVSGYHHKMVGTPAPDFELNDLDGSKVRLSDYRGRPVLLSFWAVGCPPCQLEAPQLSQFAELYAKDGLGVLAVNVWDEPPREVARFVEEQKLKQRVLLYGQEVEARYAAPAVPTLFWIDRTGVIMDVEVGYGGVKELVRKTKHLVIGD